MSDVAIGSAIEVQRITAGPPVTLGRVAAGAGVTIANDGTVGPPIDVAQVAVGAPVTLRRLTAGAAIAIQGGTRPGAGLWEGEGPPSSPLIGAQVGDEYIDTLTGNLYRLDSGE